MTIKIKNINDLHNLQISLRKLGLVSIVLEIQTYVNDPYKDCVLIAQTENFSLYAWTKENEK